VNFRGEFSLFITLVVGVTVLGVSFTLVKPLSGGTVVAQASNSINAKSQGLSGNSKTVNNNALQNILDKWNGDSLTIKVPKGIYLFDSGAIRLHSNVTFEFDKGAVFRVTSGDMVSFVYPSPNAGYNGGISNVKWKGATFQGDNTAKGQSSFTQSINHATNVTFSGCTFYDAEAPYGHDLDIDGSHDIQVTNSTFVGFNGIQDFKEAIQIDYSDLIAMSYRNPGDKYDDLPTYDVTVNKNRFLPIYGTSGQISSYAPNPIGEHAVYDNGKAGIIHDIHFTNNTVVDPKPLTENGAGNIRFIDVYNLWVTNNKFINRRGVVSGNYIYLNNVLPNYRMANLNIENNIFTNVNPTSQYIFLSSVDLSDPMTDINITGNKIITRKRRIPFVKGNFALNQDTIKIDKNDIGRKYR